jgi:hypothetical protein
MPTSRAQSMRTLNLICTVEGSAYFSRCPLIIAKDRKITIGPDTAIWIAQAARVTDIKVGSAVMMTAVKREEDGSLQVLRATIGPPGAGNPPL